MLQDIYKKFLIFFAVFNLLLFIRNSIKKKDKNNNNNNLFHLTMGHPLPFDKNEDERERERE